MAALLAFPGVASAAVTSSVDDGVLSVSSNADDPIAIACLDGKVKVNGADPDTGEALCNTITAIDVEGGPVDNSINLAGVTTAAYPAITTVEIDGAAGNDTIAGSEHVDKLLGGDGNDRISGDDNNAPGSDDEFHGQAGDDILAWNPGDDDDLMEGGDGTDTIEVNGGNGAEQFTVKPSAIAGRVQFDRSAASAGGAFNLDIGTSERLDMNANGGNDSFVAENGLLALGFALDVDGGDANDDLDGGDGPDVIDGGGGNDRIAGDDNPPNTDDVSRGGAGDDTMAWNPGDDDDVNEGGEGVDVVEVNGGGGAEEFTVKPSATAGRVQFDRTTPAPFSIDIGTSENVRVNAAGGDDRIRGFSGLAGLIAGTFNGDDGNDRIRGTDAADALSGGTGQDLIKSLDNAADTVACDTGIDLALVDELDTVRGCELVLGGRRRVATSGKAALSGGAVALRMRCAGTKRCKSKVRLRRGGKTLGKKRVELAKGRAKTVRVKLNARGRLFVANHTEGTVSMKLRVDTRDQNGNGWLTTKRIQLGR